MKRHKLIFIQTIIFILLSVSFYPVFAYMMGSSNYRIQSDSINIGGKDNQTSDSYKMRDSIGEVASGDSASSTYKLKAGYQPMQEVYISLASPGNINMNAINLTQNTSIGTGNAWNVKTDNAAGYILTTNTDQENALSSGGNQFTDYTETTAGVPETWSVSSAYEFGFSSYGNDVNTATWGNDTSCGSGSTPSTNLKYRGFDNVTAITIASSSGRTSGSGTDTVFCVAAEQNGVYASSGSYVADITATVVTQ